MMKKVLAVLLAAVLCISMGSMVLAQEAGEQPAVLTIAEGALEGDLVFAEGQAVQIVLDGAAFTGMIGTEEQPAFGAEVVLKNGASWKVTGDSYVKFIEADDTSQVIGVMEETENGCKVTAAKEETEGASAGGEGASSGVPTFTDAAAIEKIEGEESVIPFTVFGQSLDLTFIENADGQFYFTYELIPGSPIAANGTMEDAENWTISDCNFSDIASVLPDIISAYNAAK